MIKTLHFKAAVLLTAIMILPFFSFAQVTEEWAKRYNNGQLNGNDYGTAIAIDDAGNIYVTGESAGSGTAQDYYTIKYNSNGDIVWASRYNNGTANNTDIASAIVVDDSQNVYVTGRSWGTSFDYYTIKYGANGVSLWEKRYNNNEANGEDIANAIAVDGSGNVYVTGQSAGNGTNWDFYTIAYDPNGNILWTDRYNGTGNNLDVAKAIVVDESGNVYITGTSVGAGSGNDMLTIKYNSLGNDLWTARYNAIANGSDEPNALAVDESGNVYITGLSVGAGSGADYLTIKYDPNGEELWDNRYSGPNPGSSNVDDQATSIAVDASGNVFVTGRSVQGGNYNYATLKYDANGNTMWESTYDHPSNSNDTGVALALDAAGDVYVTGNSIFAAIDIATVKYNSEDGEELWVERYIPGAQGGGAQNDLAAGMAIDGSGNVYVTGYSDGSGTGVDYVTIKYSQPFFFDCPELETNIGDACDDQDETTDNDLVGEDCECAGTSTVSVETIDDAALTIFPNPNTGHCTIVLGQPYPKIEVRVMNYLGMEVQRMVYFNSPQIDMDINHPAGIYFIEVMTDRRSTIKVIKN
jgi:hypothetical protein